MSEIQNTINSGIDDKLHGNFPKKNQKMLYIEAKRNLLIRDINIISFENLTQTKISFRSLRK